MRKVEIAIIGAGTAGLTAYHQARKHTDSLLLIDPGPLGTTCARVGCMPSKLLIAAADALWQARHTDQFGIVPGTPSIDGKRVMERVRQMRDGFVGKVLSGMQVIPPHHRLDARVRFIDDHTLESDSGERIEAQRIVIATGSRANIPGFLHQAGERLLINDDLFELDTLPASVALFGPGVIGLELGQALARLDVRLRMFGVGGAVGPPGDPELPAAALDCFSSGYPLDPDAKVSSISQTEQGVEIRFQSPDGSELCETFDYLLAATGRRPNVDQLGLEHTSLQLDSRGIPLFDPHTLQCTPDHIFIAGDANNYLPLLHEAADEGFIAGANAGRYPGIQAGNRTVPLAIVFSDPQIATVGLTPAQIASQYAERNVAATFDFRTQARARVFGRAKGVMKVWAEQGSGRLLGAEILGPDAEHLGHLLAWTMQQQLSVAQVLQMPFYHPVIEEGLRSLLRDLQAQLR